MMHIFEMNKFNGEAANGYMNKNKLNKPKKCIIMQLLCKTCKNKKKIYLKAIALINLLNLNIDDGNYQCS